MRNIKASLPYMLVDKLVQTRKEQTKRIEKNWLRKHTKKREASPESVLICFSPLHVF